MTEAKRVVRRSARRESGLLALLEEVARTANEADSLEEAGRFTLDAVCRSTAWPAGHLCLPAPDDPAVFVSSGIWRGTVDFAVLREETVGVRFGAGVGLVGTVVRTGRPSWSQDVIADPNFIRGRRGVGLGVGSAFAFPVPGRDGVAAVLEFFSERKVAPDAELMRVMGTIGAQLGRVADRVQARRELEASARRQEQIIETSAEAFVSIDDDGMITAWNAAAEQMFGMPRDVAIGRPLAETIVPPEFRQAHRSGLARFLATGEKRVLGTRIEIAAWRPDTGEFPVELAIWALREGDRWTFNAFLHDIRARRLGEQALHDALEQERSTAARLRALDQAKDEFVATVSHELRTPLTSISGYLELLLDGDAGPVPAYQEHFLQTMARNSARLRTLVEDLLLISRMDTGGLGLVIEPTSLADVVERAVGAVSTQATARGQRIEVVLDPVVGTIPADPAHLERAVGALLSNAVKFGHEDGVIRVEGRRRIDAVELSVTDTGVGIDPDDVSHLFDRFFRTSQATAGAVQGAGLGLTIARRIVEEHGGSIAVESKPGEGSAFTVRLPG